MNRFYSRLFPIIRAAKSDHERQTLQNAIPATDQQIDALVYELYGLGEDDIRIVEGTSSLKSPQTGNRLPACARGET